MGKQWLSLFFWAPKSLQMVIAVMKLKDTPWNESYNQLRQHTKKQRHHFTNKSPSSQNYDFSSSHVRMWEFDNKEGLVLKNWCFQTVMLEKTLESPLESKVIKPVNPKGNQLWLFIERTDAEAETPVIWPCDAKKLTHWKRLWCWERSRAGGEGDDRGWDDWTAPLAQWTWVWVNSGR